MQMRAQTEKAWLENLVCDGDMQIGNIFRFVRTLRGQINKRFQVGVRIFCLHENKIEMII